jgi:predicted RNA methylase
VYYTPQYVVDYIVQNTVGKLLDGKTPKDATKIKIVDPACGCGNFLLGAYQYLLDWHLNFYTQYTQNKINRPRGLKTDVLTPDGKLTTSEKKRILLNNIYGVDIDMNAVEVTKLSLLLKCMEGEMQASIEQQRRLFHDRVLPPLESNILCGNSLIDTDFYDEQLDFGDEKKIKPFNWQHAFPNVFAKGGKFDVVMGNPPYGATFTENETKYFLKMYQLQNYQLDSYFLFIEKGLKLLTPNTGLLGFIIPNTWLLNLKNSKIRQHLFSKTEIENIVHYQIPVFTQAVVDTEIMIFKNRPSSKTHKINIEIHNKQNERIQKRIKQQNWIDAQGSPVNIFDSKKNHSIKNKAMVFPLLDLLCKITQGTKPFQIGKGKPPQSKKIVKEKPFVSETKIEQSFRPLLRGSLMNRYQINWNKNYFIKFGDWLAEPRYSADYDAKEKIIVRQTGDRLNATLDVKQFIVRDNLYTIVPKDESINLRYILGLLNSKFLTWYYQNIINPEKGEALAQVKRGHLALLPIAKSNKKQENSIIKLVDQLLKLNVEKSKTKLQTNLSQIESKITYCEDKINELVYQLYGLTEEEIKIVEEK